MTAAPTAAGALAHWQRLIQALRAPAAYPHPVERVELIETHISAVLLAGEYAYKLKKPVDLGFLDFTSLDRRRYFCEEELRLNRRLAPQLYLEVLPVTGRVQAPRMGGSGAALEWAVRMRRFPQRQMAGQRLAAGDLAPAAWTRLAQRLAEFHHCLPPAFDSTFGSAGTLAARSRDSFATLRRLCPQAAGLQRLETWSGAALAHLHPAVQRRQHQGRVRECHGDLHLDNLVCLDGELVPFDALEFDPALRHIDVLDELAFLTMDLVARDAAPLARRVLDAWLAASGDCQDLDLLRWYQVDRAVTRAKVAALRAAQRARRAADAAAPYLRAARRLARPRRRWLAITHGVSGSGKSCYSGWLLEQIDVIRLRSDVERRRLTDAAPATGAGAYTAERRGAVYARLRELAQRVLEAGWPVLLDATFLERRERQLARALAARLDVPFCILELRAPAAVLEHRVRARAAAGNDASEADLAVLAAQRRRLEPLEADERACTLRIDTTRSFAVPAPLAGR